MPNPHARRTVRYYVLAVVFLLFLFLSNDFGLIDVQKTAIVMSVGIDKDEDEFLITSQVAVPQSTQKSTQTVQLVSRGKTVADALNDINEKTGWYPKLVFCNLILIGEDAAKENVFNALEFFLRDEYLSDNCLVAVCKGDAKSILNTNALVDPASSVAIEKILSSHAARAGSALPCNLKDFAIGYYSDAKSGYLPIVKITPQQEKTNKEEQGGNQNGGQEERNSQGEQGGQSASSGENQQKSGQSQDKPVFSADETALFVHGKLVETLTKDQTFALATVLSKLQLADFTVDVNGNACALSIRNNRPKTKLTVGNDGYATFRVNVRLTAGARDYSKALPLDKIRDAGDVPDGAFSAAQRKLEGDICAAFEKSRACGCDLFGLQERLFKYGKRSKLQHQSNLLSVTKIDVSVRFEAVR